MAGAGNSSFLVTIRMAKLGKSVFHTQRFDRLDDWRPLVAHIPRGGMLEARGLYGSGPENVTQLIEADLLANVKLDEYQNGAVERLVSGLQGRRGFRDRSSLLPSRLRDDEGTGFWCHGLPTSRVCASRQSP